MIVIFLSLKEPYVAFGEEIQTQNCNIYNTNSEI